MKVNETFKVSGRLKQQYGLKIKDSMLFFVQLNKTGKSVAWRIVLTRLLKSQQPKSAKRILRPNCTGRNQQLNRIEFVKPCDSRRIQEADLSNSKGLTTWMETPDTNFSETSWSTNLV